MTITEKNLRLAVGKAFAEVPYPGDGNIGLTGPHEGSISAKEVTRIFKGKHWKQVLKKSNSWFRHHYWVFSSLTPSAYHFYLPAFVIRSVTDGYDLDLVPAWIAYNFMRPSPEHAKILMPGYIARMSTFTPKQKNVLLAFLKFLKNGHCKGDLSMNKAISDLRNFRMSCMK